MEKNLVKLEQLECPHSEIPPAITHTGDSQWFTSDPKSKQDKVKVTNLKKLPKIEIFKFCKKLYMRHTFWSQKLKFLNFARNFTCDTPSEVAINMKWIQPEL